MSMRSASRALIGVIIDDAPRQAVQGAFVGKQVLFIELPKDCQRHCRSLMVMALMPTETVLSLASWILITRPSISFSRWICSPLGCARTICPATLSGLSGVTFLLG